MGCGCCNSNCNPTVVVDPPCSSCLQISSLIYGCDQEFMPCGDTIVVDLSDYNNVEVCTGTVTYTLVSVESPGIEAEITSDGVLTITSSNYYELNKLWKVIYKVNCSNSLLSGTGTVSVCMKQPCDSECRGNCNPCTGNCLITEDYVVECTETEGEVNSCGDTGTLDITGHITTTECDSGDLTYEIVSYSSAFSDVIISEGGILTYTTTDSALPNHSYDINLKIKCDAYGIVNTMTISVCITSLCDGTECLESETCNECTGDCESTGDVDLDLS